MKTLLLISLAGVLCTFSKLLLMEIQNLTISFESLANIPQLIFGGIVISLFTGVPFAALWALAVILCDPAWSFERWHSVVGSDNPE